MFKNLRMDLRNYRDWCFKGRPLWLAALMLPYVHPAATAVLWFRFGSWTWRLNVPVLRQIVQGVYALGMPFVRIYSGVQIQPQTPIGPGLILLHFGGVVITRQCEIGPNCTLHQGFNVVTTNNRQGARIGANFYAGVGVSIVGNLVVGDNVVCGAGSVVTRSIPDFAVVAGVPARILRFRDECDDPRRIRHGGHAQAPFLELNRGLQTARTHELGQPTAS